MPHRSDRRPALVRRIGQLRNDRHRWQRRRSGYGMAPEDRKEIRIGFTDVVPSNAASGIGADIRASRHQPSTDCADHVWMVFQLSPCRADKPDQRAQVAGPRARRRRRPGYRGPCSQDCVFSPAPAEPEPEVGPAAAGPLGPVRAAAGAPAESTPRAAPWESTRKQLALRHCETKSRACSNVQAAYPLLFRCRRRARNPNA